MFKLSDLLAFNNIVIQCHDNPDADTISCAFAISTYLEEHGKIAPIIYGGFQKIKKSNIKLMIEYLEIKIEHKIKIKKPDLLLCVDCQYGEGNVTHYQAENIAVIDHHIQVSEIKMGIIQPHLRSCATIVWELLNYEGFDLTKHINVATAMYYGLFTDTNSFAEIGHPKDKDMRDIIGEICDLTIINRLRNCNLTLDELEIAGVALIRNTCNPKKQYAIFKAENCDPNILGFIGDICLQVDMINVCVIYSKNKDGVKLSVRSCAREVKASEYILYITKNIGSGGGHRDKAGGYINNLSIDEMDYTIDEYIRMKTEEYFDSYDVYDSDKHNLDIDNMKRYRSLPVLKGFVVTTDIFDTKTPLMIRTLEGDSNACAAPDIYLMIGVKGEVYPIQADKFHMSYKLTDQSVKIIFDENNKYTPTVKNEVTGEIKDLLPYIKSCVSTGETSIFVKKLTRYAKILTRWNKDGYMYGKPGDYIAVRCDDRNDVYIIDKDIFLLTYEEEYA